MTRMLAIAASAAVLVALCVRNANAVEIRAMDGFGDPVDWWFVMKLPQNTFPAEELSRLGSQDPRSGYSNDATFCDCPAPKCDYDDGESHDDTAHRASGLCYLYADSNNPEFRWFKDVTKGGKPLECLGQGGNDPVSQTLKQIYDNRDKSQWAFWNDDFTGTMQSPGKSCGAGFGHSKGAAAYNKDGGFYLQSTTPSFPDPSLGDRFAPLGCQEDDNTIVSQTFFSASMDLENLRKLAPAVKVGRLCTGQNDAAHQSSCAGLECQSPVDPDIGDVLTEAWSGGTVKDASTSVDVETVGGVTIRAVGKSHVDEVPPWVAVAHFLQSDISVATWWDGSHGTPSICRGDKLGTVDKDMCVVDDEFQLNADGGAEYSVENIIAVAFDIDGKSRGWGMWGMPNKLANHGKWGLSTGDGGDKWFSSGDMNMQGFPCSKDCGGSQNGRGGVFFSIKNDQMWASLHGLVASVCACGPHSQDSNRFCNFGCHKHNTDWAPEPFAAQDTSFWTQKAWRLASADAGTADGTDLAGVVDGDGAAGAAGADAGTADGTDLAGVVDGDGAAGAAGADAGTADGTDLAGVVDLDGAAGAAGKGGKASGGSDDGGDGGSSTGLIVGCVVGGLMFVALIVAAAVWKKEPSSAAGAATDDAAEIRARQYSLMP